MNASELEELGRLKEKGERKGCNLLNIEYRNGRRGNDEDWQTVSRQVECRIAETFDPGSGSDDREWNQRSEKQEHSDHSRAWQVAEGERRVASTAGANDAGKQDPRGIESRLWMNKTGDCSPISQQRRRRWLRRCTESARRIGWTCADWKK